MAGFISTKNGLYMPAMRRMKAADASGNQISTAEVKAEAGRMIARLESEYAGLTSSAGLAADRNTLAKTARAIQRNSSKGHWSLTPKAEATLKEFFGPKLDGKAGVLADVVRNIRSDIKANGSRYTY